MLLFIVAVTAVNVGAFALDVVARIGGVRVAALSGYEDFVRLTVGPALLMVFPYCQLKRGHVTVKFLTRGLNPATTNRLDALWRRLTAVAAALLAVALTLGMLETRADNALSPILGWREWLFYPPAVAAAWLWALTAAWGDDDE